MTSFAEKVKRWYDQGLWNERMVRNAVVKGRITQEECDEILKGGE